MSTWRLTIELSSIVLPASGKPNPTNPNGPSDPSDQIALAKGTTGNKPNTRPPATTCVQSPILADLARLNMLDLLFTSSPGSGKVNENRAQLLASAFQRYDIDGSGELDERELAGAAEPLPALEDLPRPQVAEDRVNLGRGLEVAGGSPGEVGTAVVAVLGMAERERHEARERDRPFGLDRALEDAREGRRALGEREVVADGRGCPGFRVRHGCIVARAAGGPAGGG